MKIIELLKEAKVELEEKKKDMAKKEVMERLKEVHMAKRVLNRLENSFLLLLEKDVDDVDL